MSNFSDLHQISGKGLLKLFHINESRHVGNILYI